MKACKKHDQKEEIHEIASRIEAGIRSITESTEWKSLLKMYAKLHRYSLRNTILLYQQMPSLTMVASYHTWKKVGRQVSKGETGLKIIAPRVVKIKNQDEEEVEMTRFGVAYVFDISQTYPIDYDGEFLQPRILENLQYNAESLRAFLGKLIRSSPILVIIDPEIEEGCNGFYDLSQREIHIRSELSSLHMIKTWAHEMAHYYVHSMRDDVARDYDEIIAESVAYVVIEYLRLNLIDEISDTLDTDQIDSSSFSFPYLASWTQGDLRMVSAGLKEIEEISRKLIDLILHVCHTP